MVEFFEEEFWRNGDKRNYTTHKNNEQSKRLKIATSSTCSDEHLPREKLQKRHPLGTIRR